MTETHERGRARRNRLGRAHGARRSLIRSASVLALTFGAFAAGAANAQVGGGVPSGQTPAQAAAAPPQTVPAAANGAVPSPASTSATSTSGVAEVVVTAERRSVNIQTTPISMSAISGNQLQEKEVTRIADLATQTPGLSITAGGLTQNVNIRGLGNTTISPNVTTGVAVFRDGLYEPEAILLSEPFYDIADVEVLRGPQGTIVGQNSTGGALQITSRNPNFDGINGYVELTGGNYNDRRADGALNLPISDTLAARVAFNVRTRDSFYTNVGGGLSQGTSQSTADPGHIDEKNVRLGLLWRPNESFQALLKAEFNDLQTGGYTPRPLPPCSLCAPESSYFQYGYQNLGKFDLNYNRTDVSDHQIADRYSLELRYKLPNGITLRSLTGFQHLQERKNDDVDASAAPHGFYDFHVIGPENQYYSEELNLLSPDDGPFTWLLGASTFYRSTPVHLSQFADGVTPAADSSNASFALDSTSIQRLSGIFGQASYQILPTLQIQVGGRMSFDNNQGGGTVTPAPGFVLSQDGHYAKDVPTGKVTLNWAPVEGQFFYAFAARGYKEGGINNILSDFGPEYVNDYEIGWKGRLFDNHLQTQVGGYWMKYEGMQQQVISPDTGQATVVNLGDSTIKGIEASAQARYGGWNVDVGFAYNASSLGSIRAIAGYELPAGVLGPQCAAGVTPSPGQCFNYAPYYVDLSGEQDPYSPKYTFNATVSYDFHVWNGVLTPRASYSYQSQQYASIFQNTTFYRLQPRSLLDLALTYSSGQWEVEAFARNVANQIYLAGISSGNDGFWGDPRTYGVRVQRSF